MKRGHREGQKGEENGRLSDMLDPIRASLLPLTKQTKTQRSRKEKIEKHNNNRKETNNKEKAITRNNGETTVKSLHRLGPFSFHFSSPRRRFGEGEEH